MPKAVFMDYRIPPNRRAVVMFGIVIFIVAALTLLGAGLKPYWQKSQAQTWTKVQGEVLSTSIETEQHKNSTTYIPKVRYRYQVGGLDYLGSAIRFGLPESGPNAAQVKLKLHPFPAGATPVVFVDPTNPRNAVLDISEVNENQITPIVAGITLALLGVMALVVLWRERSGDRFAA